MKLFQSLKNHPFPVKAHFDSSVVLTFSVAKKELEDLIPDCLELDLYNDEVGFIALAMVQTRNLRPAFFPSFLGNNFFLVGCRIFVKYRSSTGKIYRGLYILKSMTDKKKMEILGNIFTHYNYSTTDISKAHNENDTIISSRKSSLNVNYRRASKDIKLPKNSVFSDWKTARKYAGPLPFTFTHNKEKNEILIIQGVRKDWKPKPLHINQWESGFIDSFDFKTVQLASAFIVEDIPYKWLKGKIEKLEG